LVFEDVDPGDIDDMVIFQHICLVDVPEFDARALQTRIYAECDAAIRLIEGQGSPAPNANFELPEPETDPDSKPSKSKRSWTQTEADTEISKYKADRSPHFYDLVNKIDKSSGSHRKRVIKSARKVFGRNAISRETGIPQGMVSKSSEWEIIKTALHFDDSLGTKSHFGKAIEDSSEAAGDQTADAVEQSETISLINARVGRHFTIAEATALIEDLIAGRRSDDNAREVLDALDTP
jgi:hypothetical protein